MPETHSLAWPPPRISVNKNENRSWTAETREWSFIWRFLIKLLYKTYLKVDVSIGQPTGTALVKEVDILNEQAEEWNNDLKMYKKTQQEVD